MPKQVLTHRKLTKNLKKQAKKLVADAKGTIIILIIYEITKKDHYKKLPLSLEYRVINYTVRFEISNTKGKVHFFKRAISEKSII